ncbi:MAG: sulfotransferase [Methanobacteriota archaeon]|nr:MAG: sulfotransferase [Euryarchaeota archaeon]
MKSDKFLKKIRRIVRWYLPDWGRIFLYKGTQMVNDMRLVLLPVSHVAGVDNVYHCTVHKAGSQWFKTLFFDPLIYRYSGLKPLFTSVYGITDLDYRKFRRKSFPNKRIITPLYVSYENFCKIDKPRQFRVLYVLRDPRDLVVSMYFSLRYTHVPMGDVMDKRQILKNLSVREGIIWTIQHCAENAVFDSMVSWIDVGDSNPNLLIVRLEDLVGEKYINTLRKILLHSGIRVPDKDLEYLAEKYHFKRVKERDHRTTPNGLSHYRSGKPGDWQKYFDEEMVEFFKSVAPGLVERLGYEW